jgi:hypothetical protein
MMVRFHSRPPRFQLVFQSVSVNRARSAWSRLAGDCDTSCSTLVEALDGAIEESPSQVSVALSDRDGTVTHQFAHDEDFYPRHDEPRGERVAQVVPVEVDDLRLVEHGFHHTR